MERLKDTKAHFLSAINFKAFEPFLPPGIGLTDIDGELERNYWFLRLEKKKLGEEVTVGQRILLEHLSELPEFTVVVFWGSEWNPDRVERWDGEKHTSLPGLQGFVGQWWEMADRTTAKPRQ